jgi:hypothetical protein
MDFEEKYNEYAPKAKLKKLKDSIEIASKILKGKTTYKGRRILFILIDEVRRIER